MSASFESLPVEMTENIVECLSLQDIKSLRLTCHAIHTKASQGRLRSFYATKEINLREPDLNEFASYMSPERLPCWLENLTVNGVLYVTKGLEKILRLGAKPRDLTDPMCIARRNERRLHNRLALGAGELAETELKLRAMKRLRCDQEAEQQKGYDLHSLIRLFKNLQKYGKTGRLKTITLKVVVYRDTTSRLEPKDGGDWRPIWDTAIRTYSITLSALHRSGMQIDRLNAYSGLRRCCLPGFDIARFLEACDPGATVHPLSSLKAFSLSTSSRLLPPRDGLQAKIEADPDDEIWEKEASGPNVESSASPYLNGNEWVHASRVDSRGFDPRILEGVPRILQRTPNLEELDLHYYHLSYAKMESAAIIRHIASLPLLPNLKMLTLRGFNANCPDLLTLLRQSPLLEYLHLCSVRCVTYYLDGAGWRCIFDYVTHPSNRFTYLQFEDLFDGTPRADAYLHFYNPDTQHMPLFTAIKEPPHVFVRKGREEVMKPIQFDLNLSWMIGVYEQFLWREELRKEYGPPNGIP